MSSVQTAELRISGLDQLSNRTLGDPGVLIAVLDGPVDLSHACFRGARITQLESLIPASADEGPATKHGTHVASVIFGQPGGPVRGVAPHCSGLIIPVFKSVRDGSSIACSQLDLARAIGLAVQRGARIINISGGQIEPSGQAHHLLADAVRSCARQNVLIVAAAGNDGCECLHIPAALESVLVVGAMDDRGDPLPTSNWGGAYRSHGILAPGAEIGGASPFGGHVLASGTSYATPIVSGVAGLLLSVQLAMGLEPDTMTIRRALVSSAAGCDVQPAADCSRLLSGRLNIEGAVAQIIAQIMEGGIIKMSNHERNQLDGREKAVHSSSTSHRQTEADSAEPAISEAIASGVPVSGTEAGPGGTTSEASRSLPVIDAMPLVQPSSGCGCSSAAAPLSLVYAIGQIDHSFTGQARRDYFVQQGLTNPDDPETLVQHLEANPTDAAAVTWTLNQETVAIYAIQPGGPFAAEAYELLRQFLRDQLKEVERVSIPGVVTGKTTLMNGQTVPTVTPAIGGMASWSTAALLKAHLGRTPTKEDQTKVAEISNFIHRVHYELRGLGLAPSERAMNYAATNLFQAREAFESALKQDLRLDSIDAEVSPICRPDSDCWDVVLTFFNPSKRFEQARLAYRFTIDVSDVVPVPIGDPRSWFIY